MKDNEIENFFEGKFEIPQFDSLTANQARKLQNQLTKPVGSLGKLEDLAIWMAGWQSKIKPKIDNAQCLIFAGNHGISAWGISISARGYISNGRKF